MHVGRRAARSVVGTLLLGLAAPSSAWASPTRVALVVHPVVNVPEAESKAIALELATALRARFDAEIIAGDPVRNKLPARVPEDCVSDAACIGEVGDRVGADQLLFLVMVRVGTKVQIDATWAEIQTGRALPRDPVELNDAGPSRASVLGEVAGSMIPRGSVPLRGVAAGGGSGGGGGEAGLPTKAETTLPVGPTSDPWRAGKTTDQDLDFVAWGFAGLSAASLGVGVALVLGGLADYNEQIEQGCPERAEIRGSCVDVIDRFATRSNIANMLLVGAGLAAATSVALFAVGASDDGALSAVVGPDGVGLSYGGRF